MKLVIGLILQNDVGTRNNRLPWGSQGEGIQPGSEPSSVVAAINTWIE
jgi:hypothetical protein